MKNSVNVCGRALVCAQARVYLFPQVENIAHKYCHAGEVKAGIDYAFLQVSYFCLCSHPFEAYIYYTLLNEHQPHGNHSSPSPWVTLVPVLCGALITEPRVKVEHSEDRWAGVSGHHVTSGALCLCELLPTSWGPDRQEGDISPFACLLDSILSSLPSPKATSLVEENKAFRESRTIAKRSV